MAATEKKKAKPKKHPAKGRTEKKSPDVTVKDRASGREPDVTSTVTTAPASAASDADADQADQDMQAFFSTGSGPVMHYDLQDMAGPEQAAQTAGGSAS